ncbi:hypothetical protein [Metaclostridioides mangenotii]|uniref:hypothetical protein n=1 Tax=Metaclostridioides mangenotii TaxID=1540 RepID=UPI000466FB8D|nr:hypothetical protein [Clostridioides mangenotii]
MVKQKIEIDLYKPSEEYLNIDKKCGYKETTEEITKIKKGRCIIHTIPVRDTYSSDDNEKLDGFCDAILFRVKVYDCKNRIVYSPDRLFDNITFLNGVECQTRISKDLSNMYIFDFPVEIDYIGRNVNIISL